MFRGEKIWYLGVSSWRELKTALAFNFDGIDITTMALGSFSKIKDIEYVKRRLKEVLRIINTNQAKLTEFLKH